MAGGRPIAHRGLWRPAGPPENSLAAIEAACAAGHDLEIDLQRTADGRAVVFHDPDLKRMTGREGRVRDLTAAELGRVPLKGSDETIPTLEQALAVIGRRATAYLELKTPTGDEGPLEAAAARALTARPVAAVVVGFNPWALAELRRIAPAIPRGLSGSGRVDYDARLAAYDAGRAFRPEHLELVDPQQLIVGKDLLPSPALAALRRGGLPVVAWTLRAAHEVERLRPHCDGFMYEGFAA